MGKPVWARLAAAFVAAGSGVAIALVAPADGPDPSPLALILLLCLLAVSLSGEAIALLLSRRVAGFRPPPPPGVVFVAMVTIGFAFYVIFLASWVGYLSLWTSVWWFAHSPMPLPFAAIAAAVVLAWLGSVLLAVRWLAAGPALVRREPGAWSRVFGASLGIVVVSAVGLSAWGFPYPQLPDPLIAGLGASLAAYLTVTRPALDVPRSTLAAQPA